MLGSILHYLAILVKKHVFFFYFCNIFDTLFISWIVKSDKDKKNKFIRYIDSCFSGHKLVHVYWMELIERTNKRSCLDRSVHKIISEVSMQTY